MSSRFESAGHFWQFTSRYGFHVCELLLVLGQLSVYYDAILVGLLLLVIEGSQRDDEDIKLLGGFLVDHHLSFRGKHQRLVKWPIDLGFAEHTADCIDEYLVKIVLVNFDRELGDVAVSDALKQVLLPVNSRLLQLIEVNVFSVGVFR